YAHNNFLNWRVPALWFSPEVFGDVASLDMPIAIFGRPYMSGTGWGAIGVVPLGLVFFALVSRVGPVRERLFWAGLGGITLAFLFFLATPAYHVLIRFLPWLDDVDLLRGLLVPTLCGALLAGWGAAELVAAWSRGTPRSQWLLPWLGFIAIGVVAILVGRSGLSMDRSLPGDLAPLLGLCGGVLLIGLLPFSCANWQRARTCLLLALVVGELGWLHYKVNTFASPAHTFPEHPMVTDLKARLGPPDYSRYLVLGRFRFLPPNTGATYELADIRGYSPIPIARFRTLIECAEGRSGLENSAFTENFESPIYRLLGASHVVLGSKEPPPGYEKVWNRYLYRNPASLPRAFLVHDVVSIDGEAAMRAALGAANFDPGTRAYLERTAMPATSLHPPTGTESVRITAMEPARVVIEAEASSPALLVLSDPYYPGWRATVDGIDTRILPADWALRGVEVPPGRHRVEFRYRPAWLIPGFIAMVVGTVLAVIGLAFTGSPSASPRHPTGRRT
ncbi:MAG TPA: YfhO family protein, partial [Candidatus Eisenbacteria bacterium]